MVGLNRAFVVTSSLYENISLEVLSEDYPDGYEAKELRMLKARVAPLVQALVNRIENVMLP